VEAHSLLKEMMSQGFAVAVAGYLLVRLEGRLEALTRSIDRLCERRGARPNMAPTACLSRDEDPR